MKRKYIISFVFAAALMSFNAAAQNLDPTVEISRAYEGKIMEAKKPVREINVPDSVGTFRLDFDYSVFENPYRGAYEFNPYFMSMRPAGSAYEPKSFYLKVGAGYRLYPELDLIWSPIFKKGFSMDVYASHQSYIGDYRNIGLSGEPGADRKLVQNGDETWNGYDMVSKAGVNGRYAWKAGNFGFNVNYFGQAGKTMLRSRCYDAVDASLSLSSNKNAATSFLYDAELRYRFAEDKLQGDRSGYLKENLASLNGHFGYVFNSGDKLMFNYGAQVASYGSGVRGTAGKFNIIPHYVMRRGRFALDAGVKVDMVIPSQDTELGNIYSADGQQYVYPDIKVSYNIIKDAMNAYVDLTGGTKMNTYESIIYGNHYADYSYGSDILDSNVERVKMTVGLQGRIGKRFSYNLRAGYAIVGQELLASLAFVDGKLMPSLTYASCHKGFAALDWKLDTESFKFDGTVAYTDAWDIATAGSFFTPPALAGKVAFEYNWKRRIFAGVDCGFATARKLIGIPEAAKTIASSVTLPGYADLGVSFEYALNRKLSFWLRGGNLCCMTIQRTPLYAEGGINFTAGICLNL